MVAISHVETPAVGDSGDSGDSLFRHSSLWPYRRGIGHQTSESLDNFESTTLYFVTFGF